MEEEKKEHWSKRGIKGDKNIRLKGGRSSMKRGSMCCCYERDRESVRERKRFEKLIQTFFILCFNMLTLTF